MGRVTMSKISQTIFNTVQGTQSSTQNIALYRRGKNQHVAYENKKLRTFVKISTDGVTKKI